MTHKLEHTIPVHEEPEPWHRHSPEEGEPQQEHAGSVNTTILLGVFVATVVFVFASILFTYLYFTRYMTNLRQEQIETTVMASDYRDYKERSAAALGQFGWVDAEAGVVSLPLEVAKARVLERYGSK